MDRRDPIQAVADDSLDLQDIVEWDPRSRLDRVAVIVYHVLLALARSAVVALAALILVVQVVLGGLGTVTDPAIGTLTVLSAVPALALAVYVWRADVTTGEPLSLLVATFLLGVLFAGFAGIVNSLLEPVFVGSAALVGVPALGMVAMFFVVVGPVEEGVKLLAVRLHAFRDGRFDAVIDGAVYGAIAGLGFATIENTLYITAQTSAQGGLQTLAGGSGIATVRALAGPGHVIYSAIAGYYLGLAKFNPDDAGPIVVKGLLIAALVHGGYNALVSFVPFGVANAFGIGPFVALVGFVIVYDGLLLTFLLGKLRAYRRAYLATRPDPDRSVESELTEFDP
ncbi:PrsW family intramembrane metalloprotease [Halorhabdus amylolytica]|uniref:PrsW family intramembrane metalloprotease n=1 Tax=Halorhabdus amylolytica TaxID=2559573 RepID=UPI0010AABE96|nr:PrsW family glutamic-type intramembrane protease [Halorhabdus amylolytica]